MLTSKDVGVGATEVTARNTIRYRFSINKNVDPVGFRVHNKARSSSKVKKYSYAIRAARPDILSSFVRYVHNKSDEPDIAIVARKPRKLQRT